jgi:translation initiation factor IF-1
MLRVLTRGRDENPGQLFSSGGPSRLKIMLINSISVLAWKSGSLRMSSAKIQPMDHISISVEYSVAPNRISGAL